MNNQFSENLKKIRKEHNLSQEQLADELGVSRQAISKWESAAAYPEMDKIIALCNKFDLNIDDLLHKDIKEIKGEEESKRKLNKSIDDFLKFITDTINLFSNMSFKSKIKCLLEQIIIIGILIVISFLIINVGNAVFYDLLFFLPSKMHLFIRNCLTYILVLFCLISSIIIFTHIFKTRYLDYFAKLKKEINKESIDDANELKNINKQKQVNDDNKILFQKNENKIIIRDPKHSEYKFINSLFKFIIGIIKFFAICLGLFICFLLIVLFICLILSFLVYKTNFFFLGLLITILSSIVIIVIVLLIILNFVFSRQNDKKKMIWGFLISLMVFGSGLGLICIGTLAFQIVNNDKTMLKIETREYEMKENTFFNFPSSNIKYVEENIDNIKIEFEINKYYNLDIDVDSNIGINMVTYCNDPIKLTKEFIKSINNKKMPLLTSDINSIVVYASKENIEKLKINQENYFKAQEKLDNQINYYENIIANKEQKIENYKNKISEYKNKIEEYETIISSCENE